MGMHSTLLCGIGILVFFSGSAHAKCQPTKSCNFPETTGSCMPRSVALDHPDECPKETFGSCQFPQACACCKTCKPLGCNEMEGYVCMTKGIAATSTWFDYEKDCKVSDKLCQKWSGDPNQETCLCCPKKPPIEDTCVDKGCSKEFNNDGICVNTAKTGWNLNNDIDLKTGMKQGLCLSKNEDFCCGCFKKKECEQDRTMCKSSRKVSRKCYKDMAAPVNYFWTGRICNKMPKCKCFQECKQSRKCNRIEGRCLRAFETTPDGWIKHGYCDKAKNCMCYTSTDNIDV